MSRRLRIDPQTKQYIEDKIAANGIINVDEVVAIIHPFYQSHPVLPTAREEKLYPPRLLPTTREDKGPPTCFATKDPEHPQEYVDIEHATDLHKLDGVIKQLVAKRNGLDGPIRKAMRKRKQIVGQMAFKDYKASGEQPGSRG